MSGLSGLNGKFLILYKTAKLKKKKKTCKTVFRQTEYIFAFLLAVYEHCSCFASSPELEFAGFFILTILIDV